MSAAVALIDTPICAQCAWWDLHALGLAKGHGLCRRHSPQVDMESGRGFWPVVRYSDWCGEGEYSPEQVEDEDEGEPATEGVAA